MSMFKTCGGVYNGIPFTPLGFRSGVRFYREGTRLVARMDLKQVAAWDVPDEMVRSRDASAAIAAALEWMKEIDERCYYMTQEELAALP